MSKNAHPSSKKKEGKLATASTAKPSKEESHAQSSQEQEQNSCGHTDPSMPPCVFHTDIGGRTMRHCVLMNNGVWMPIIGLSVCKGDAAQIEQTVEAAVLAGYRHIDTAHASHNETAIGNALRRVIASGKVKREELFIVTKLPCEGNHRDKVRKYLRSSLKKLQLPYVDLYLIHFPVYERGFKRDRHRQPLKVGSAMEDLRRRAAGSPKGASATDLAAEIESPESSSPDDESGSSDVDLTNILETWRGMEDAANLGMTRSIGLCNFNKNQISRILSVAAIKPANLQIECHAYLNQQDLVEFCKQHSISVTAYAPLGSPAGSGVRSPSAKEEGLAENYHTHSTLLQNSTLRKMAERYKKTPAQILIRWLLQRGLVALPRSTSPAHIREDIQVFDFELSEADSKTLFSLNKNQRLFTYDVYGLPSRAEYPFK